MIMNLGFKYKLQPDNSQKSILENYMFIDNQIRNICINLNLKRYQANLSKEKSERKYLSYNDYYNACKGILSERHIKPKTAHLNVAIRNFEKDLKLTFKVNSRGLPKFHKAENHKHFTINNQNFKISNINSKWSILKFYKQKIKFRRHREFEGRPLFATITRDSVGDFYVSICCECQKETPENNGSIVGIDLNIHNITTSDGIVYLNQFQTKHTLKLKNLERKKSSKRIGSNKRKFLQRKINLLHRKASRKITDFNHKVTKILTSSHKVVVAEDLKLAKMQTSTKVHRGTKRNLSQSKLGEILSFLQYKAKLNGAKIESVNPAYTSKRCPRCGRINNSLELSDRTYNCICGLSLDRDYNAAINIRKSYREGTSQNALAYAAGGLQKYVFRQNLQILNHAPEGSCGAL